jgi:hypothetical protein
MGWFQAAIRGRYLPVLLMKKDDISAVLRHYFPSLNHPELSEAISEKAVFLTIPAGKILLNTGDHIHLIPLVTKGSIKGAT